MKTLMTRLKLTGFIFFLSACSATNFNGNLKTNSSLQDGYDNSQNHGVKTCCINPDGLKEPIVANITPTASVYFEYDGYMVQDEFKNKLIDIGKQLIQHKDEMALLQGNTDERGGHEYNLALGQKRAESVRLFLTTYGVDIKQMEAISYGKERPRAEGNDEASWAENRRVDIILHH